jgi:hypothetical protein
MPHESNVEAIPTPCAPTWQCEFCGRFYSERTAKQHAYCIQQEDRRCAESMWPA